MSAFEFLFYALALFGFGMIGLMVMLAVFCALGALEDG